MRNSLMLLACLVTLLSGCAAGQPDSAERFKDSGYELTCIAVLPVAPGGGSGEDASGRQDASLVRGSEIMNELLAQELGRLPAVRFVNADHISGLQLTGGENELEMLRLVAASADCNGVLKTRLLRFSERIGGRYTAEEPAAVAFDMQLIGVDAGDLLWAATFDEQQRSVLENLYEWKKAKSRGFTWISATDLMLEGIREKLAACPCFGEPKE